MNKFKKFFSEVKRVLENNKLVNIKANIEKKAKDYILNNFTIAKKFQELKKRNHAFARMIKQRIRKITSRMMRGFKPTSRMKQELEVYKKFFVDTREDHPVNSSWIISARYYKNKKQLWLKMTGKRVKWYKFDNVPIWVWGFLVSQPAHAGTQWWHKGFGVKYSSNPSHWIMTRRK